MANKDNPRKGSHVEFSKDKLIKLIDNLNLIPSSTDKEERLIEYINKWCNKHNLPTERCGNGNCAKVAPLYIGPTNAKYVFVTHCDRFNKENKKDSQPVCVSEEEIVGKLDNTASLALCLSFHT